MLFRGIKHAIVSLGILEHKPKTIALHKIYHQINISNAYAYILNNLISA